MTFQMVFRGFLLKPRSLASSLFGLLPGFLQGLGFRVNGSSTEFYKGFGLQLRICAVGLPIEVRVYGLGFKG